MVIYVEYAFLENFALDGALLYLALCAAKAPIRYKRLVISAALGGVFAVLFPLLSLPTFLQAILKIAFGFLMCMLCFKRLKTKKEWGRYASVCAFFFAFAFAAGGAILGAYGNFHSNLPMGFVFASFLLFCLLARRFIKWIYKKRAVFGCLRTCSIVYGQKRVDVLAFLDSGNLASKNGVPVCFVSPELVYEIWGKEIIESEGQVRDELCITTISGIKTVAVYKGVLETEKGKKEVYFSPSANMISREYKLLLHSQVFDEND